MNPRLPKAPRAFRPTHLVQRRLRALGFTEKHDWLAHNLGIELGFLNHEMLEPCGTPVTSSGGFELLGSYNWHRRTKFQRGPKIYVPGEAPQVVLPRKLPLVTGLRSKGRSFRDVNAALLPAFPFEPMFHAVGVMRPGFRFDGVDLVINRSSLQHLLRLANTGRCKDAFRLDLAMVDETLIVTPLWKRVSDSGNYGRVFEQYFTRHRLGLGASQSHHRVIRYDLGPLKIAVLCEVDAAYSEETSPPSFLSSSSSSSLAGKSKWRVGTTAETTPAVEGEGEEEEEVLLESEEEEEEEEGQVLLEGKEAEGPFGPEALKKLIDAEKRLFESFDNKAFLHKPNIDLKGRSRVVHFGEGTLSAHTAELATMKKFHGRRRSKMAQMWLGRTPYLIESLHQANTFTKIRVTHCSAQLVAWEELHQTGLQKLVTAIKMLAHLTSRAPGGHGIAVCTKDGPTPTLRVFEAADRPESPVPEGIRRRFWKRRRHIQKGVECSARPEGVIGWNDRHTVRA